MNNNFLYCYNILYVSEVIDDKVIKDKCSLDEICNFRSKEEIIKQAKSGNSKSIICIQNGDIQKIYGDNERLNKLLEIINMIPYSRRAYDNGKIILIPNERIKETKNK